ncbi:MAG: DUF2079 domain-containing protein [Thaumarchaeota archaeon]|nr:DUF2079 domain-containing protein [Nitrososphaerota archaeon]
MKGLSGVLTILIGLSLALAAYSTWIQVYYHETYNTFAWDLGIFLQSLESFVSRGKLFYNTVELPYNPSGSYFGIHFSPILFLFAIPYAIYPHPLTLFLIKNLLICLTSPILYKIGREQGLPKTQSALIAATYLLFLPLYGPLTYDFHPYSILPFLITLTHLYVLRREYHKALAPTIFGLSTNEIAAIIYIFYSLCLFLKGLRKIAKRILVLSAIWLISAFTTITLINPTQWKYYINYQFLNTLSEARLRFPTTLNADYMAFFLMLYGFLLFLPLFSPLEGVLAVLPWLIIPVIGKHPSYASPYYQYSALISAQLFLAVINVVKRLKKRKVVILTLVTLNLFSAIILSPIGFGKLDYTTSFVRPVEFYKAYRFDLTKIKPSNEEAINNALNLIPENTSILVQNHLFPHVYKRSRSYTSLIPGVNGWPVIYEDFDLREVKRISAFSTLDGKLRLLGTGEVKEIILNGKRFSSKENATVIKLENPTKIKELLFRCRLRLKNTKFSQAIFSSEAFELGVGSNGYLVLLLRSDHRKDLVGFSNIALEPGKWYDLEANITQNQAIVKVDGYIVIRLTVKNRVVAWIVDNVDYIVFDSASTIMSFRIGSVPLILGPEYKLVAAGDGVMVFSRKNERNIVQNLTESKYLMFVYASDEPSGEPVMIMPLSSLKWKLVGMPLAPQCIFVDYKGEVANVSISGIEEYAFVNPASKAYSAESVEIRCSAIIRGKIQVPESGYYVLKVRKMIPSVLEISIDGKRVDATEPIYLSAGDHSIEVVWKKIRYPLLDIELVRMKGSDSGSQVPSFS